MVAEMVYVALAHWAL